MELYQKALDLIAARERFAWAMVVHTVGSTPQKAGAKAIFDPRGPVHGTLGGGCLEAEARQRALRALDEGRAFSFALKLDEVDGWDDGLVCGGKARIFVDPDSQANAPAYEAMLEARRAGEPGVLLTVLAHPGRRAGTALWVPESAFVSEWPAECAAFEALVLEERPGLVTGTPGLDSADAEYFVEPVLPPPQLVIAGAGHIGKALAHFGKLLGFEVTIVDDRPSFAHPAQVPDARHVICGDIADTLAGMPLGTRSYVVIVTRGHQHDGQALAACIHAPTAYLGLIGSRRKSLLLRRRLLDEGLATEAEVARVVTPMGLDIGAQTVEEIALSIAAQLVAVRRRQSVAAEPLALPLA